MELACCQSYEQSRKIKACDQGAGDDAASLERSNSKMRTPVTTPTTETENTRLALRYGKPLNFTSSASRMSPTEQLPDSAPFPLFFLPNFLGILFAWILESCNIENLLHRCLHAKAHRFCLLGWGVFAVANVGSYLGGSVVVARIQYNVKLPNLYATPSDKKEHVQFNTIQRSHQNFVETYAAVVLTVLFTAFVANRPNIAGFMLLLVSLGRILYAIGYAKNISDRIAGQLLAVFTMSIGVGYAALIGCSAFGWVLLTT